MRMVNKIIGGLMMIIKSSKPELNVSKKNIVTHLITKLI